MYCLAQKHLNPPQNNHSHGARLGFCSSHQIWLGILSLRPWAAEKVTKVWLWGSDQDLLLQRHHWLSIYTLKIFETWPQNEIWMCSAPSCAHHLPFSFTHVKQVAKEMAELGPARQAHCPHKTGWLSSKQTRSMSSNPTKELLKCGLIFPKTSAFWFNSKCNNKHTPLFTAP